jgi:hypothetical protein
LNSAKLPIFAAILLWAAIGRELSIIAHGKQSAALGKEQSKDHPPRRGGVNPLTVERMNKRRRIALP